MRPHRPFTIQLVLSPTRRRFVAQSVTLLGCDSGAAHSGITMESLSQVGPALEMLILGGHRTSGEVWTRIAAEAQARAESSLMAREVFDA